MKTDIEKRICPYSGVEFAPKRTNQVFANDRYRIAYHNQKNNSKRKRLASINKPLLKNYDILNQILGDEQEKIVHKEYLRGAGFSFSVFTHLHNDPNKDKYYYAIYDFYYINLDENYYKIIKNG
ncbi:hypothetical protein [Psychroserpens algicola]|uniref:Uncharacterized protein n=1 Tax=Psychroserpens algicola TaxID=1719034 RepID=A0ABT0H989_9FLAO|nr:hypothetical protein [Psychroserpens algicola]MCK8480951.1 hypothetical protein [Psychroserpens algicola]